MAFIPARTVAWVLLSASGSLALGTERLLPLVPQPLRVEWFEHPLYLTNDCHVLVPRGKPEIRAVGEYLAAELRHVTGFGIPVLEGSGPLAHSQIALALVADGPLARRGAEAYELTVGSSVLTLRAATAAGLFRGAQTIRQLLSSNAATSSQPADVRWTFPGVRITDEPRYRWRGMLLDCCRHFMPREFVKRYIDLLACHKLNVLHWHLTEDQGWRIEIRRYPKLTEVGAWRRATRASETPRDAGGRYGGFYTQAEIREIVAYAASRHITIVPEIELPGHALAALAAYPEYSCTGGPFEVGVEWGVYDDVYCAGNDATFQFLTDVLDEVIELFPGTYIHIGGDECPKKRWEACPKCQARMQSEGLKDAHELQSYFIRRIERHLNARGRRLIGWDEILEGGLAPNATVQSWRGLEGAIAAAKAGHDVICSPTSHCYLDYPQAPDPSKPDWMAVTTLEKAYSFEPTPDALTAAEAKHVLGLEGNLWSERTPPPEAVDRQVFPRLCALAEVGWSAKEARNWDDFQRRLAVHIRRLRAQGVTPFEPPPDGNGAGAGSGSPHKP